MARRTSRVARKAIDVALESVPGSILEAVTAHTAPLTRYSGRTAAGANALASTLALLAQPPRRRRRRSSTYSLDDIASQLDESSETLHRWADEGLLGPAPDDHRWPRQALDRATLLSFAVRHGATDAELQDAVTDGRLPLIVLEHVISGEPEMSAREVARRANVDLEMALAVWRALGLPVDEVDEAAFTRNEVAALRTLHAMRTVFSQEDLIEAASVVGRAMSDVGAASVELFRRRLTARFLESGADELEVALRLSAIADLLVPPLGPLLEVVLRRHLTASARAEAALQLEQTDSTAASQRELTIAFADLVGFTSVSERLTALEVSRLAARLLHCAEAVLPRHDARIVKSIGDAVMFTARDPVTCCRAAIDLMQSTSQDEGLPPVRAGAAHGPVLRAYADYFGRTVNLAARLCDAAPANTILVAPGDEDVDTDAWKSAGLKTRRSGPLRLKGIKGRVSVLRVSA